MTEKETELKRQLLLLPRKERAEAQGKFAATYIGAHNVVRLTRRYWRVSGTMMKLSKAIDTVNNLPF